MSIGTTNVAKLFARRFGPDQRAAGEAPAELCAGFFGAAQQPGVAAGDLAGRNIVRTLRKCAQVTAAFILVVFSLALCAGPAFAQAPAANPRATAAPSPAPAAPSPLRFGRFTPLLNYTGEAATNTSGGLTRGAAFAGQLLMGFDLHLDQGQGPATSTIHFVVTNRHGGNLVGTSIGSNTSVQEIYGTQNTHLALFTWERQVERLDLEVGRIPANISFLSSPLYCNFQSNSACGNPTFVFKDSNFTFWPASSWGAHAKAWLNDRVYLHVGAYEVNPDRKTPADNGFTWNSNNMTGVIVPAELGYSTTFANDKLPRHYQIGGWYDDSDYADPQRDVNGGIATLTGLAPATDHGRSGAFVRFDQMILRPNPSSERGLTLFGVGMTSLSGRLTEDHYVELGLVQMGTFRGRDQDTLGFVVNDQHFTVLALDSIRAARVSAGGTANIPTHETMMELAYGAQLTPAVRISPNLQYILHPDQTSIPFRTSDIPNAFIIGFKFTLDVPTMMQAHAKH